MKNATVYIRLLNLCPQHKVDPLAVIGLLAVNAFAAADQEMLRFWSQAANHLRDLHLV
jgi:hypothetical protein